MRDDGVLGRQWEEGNVGQACWVGNGKKAMWDKHGRILQGECVVTVCTEDFQGQSVEVGREGWGEDIRGVLFKKEYERRRPRTQETAPQLDADPW